MLQQRPDIRIEGEGGETSIREVLSIVFYIRRPNLDIVTNVADAIHSFVDLVSIQALPEYYNYNGDTEALTAASLESIINERLIGPDRAPNAFIVLTGRGLYAPEYYLRYSGGRLDDPELEGAVNYFWCWVPRDFWIEQRPLVLDFFSRLSNVLPFHCAHASLGLVGENQLKKQALARRYPGLDISYPGSVRADLDAKVAGSYWATLLSQELSNTLGGMSAMRAELPEPITIKELPDGRTQILLGPEPEIGDVNRRNVLPTYRAFATFLRDKGVLHVPKRVVYFEDENGMADRAAMETWHNRFLY